MADGASITDELERLAALRDRGALTEEEFQTQKARLIGPSQPVQSLDCYYNLVGYTPEERSVLGGFLLDRQIPHRWVGNRVQIDKHYKALFDDFLDTRFGSDVIDNRFSRTPGPPTAPPPVYIRQRRTKNRGGWWVFWSTLLILLVAAGVVLGVPQIRHRVFNTSVKSSTSASATPSTSPTSGWQDICTSMINAHGGAWRFTDGQGNKSDVTICGYTVSGTDLEGDEAPAGEYVIDFVVAVTDEESDRPAKWSIDDIFVAPSGTGSAACVDSAGTWSGCEALVDGASLNPEDAYTPLGTYSGSYYQDWSGYNTINPGAFQMFVVASDNVSFSTSVLALFINVPGSQFSQQGSGVGEQDLPLTESAEAPRAININGG